ncbi:MAG: DUF1835 domain-containing protein [Deferrisomatales bacterium]|nr:DUF1835 domain-containing protein [Deferrisomatales bacterium]
MTPTPGRSPRVPNSQRTLHITNGDSTVSLMLQADIRGPILPWRDCLHEGPVPAGLGLRDLSAVRARYLAEGWYRTLEEIRREFAERDRTLQGFRDHTSVVLWFEHDLYDQLQLLQLLDWFSDQPLDGTALGLICIGAYPGVAPFHGLGMLTPGQLAGLREQQVPVSDRQLLLGRAGWAAFRSPDPRALLPFLEEDISSLPFLEPALRRHLEEFPSTGDGLSRSERQALAAVAGGARTPGEVFRAAQDMEEARFMGDWSFWKVLEGLLDGPHPLLATGSGHPFRYPPRAEGDDGFRRQSLALTPDGGSVLEGRANRLARQPVDRWLGGVHLAPGLPRWRWDGEGSTVVAHSPSRVPPGG